MAEARRCPICQRPPPMGAGLRRYRPFCSKRCAGIDLSRWLHGAYAIPSAEEEAAGEAETAAPEDSGGESARPPAPKLRD